jgi:hypothetical protein
MSNMQKEFFFLSTNCLNANKDNNKLQAHKKLELGLGQCWSV